MEAITDIFWFQYGIDMKLTPPACVSLAFSIIWMVAQPSIAQEVCQGEAPREHKIGKYHFKTTSRVYSRANAEFYTTCVENIGEGDLWVDWFVPGPHSFVPSGIALESPRPFVTRDTKPFKGCLAYGNFSDLMREHFLGHATDEKAIQDEEGLACTFWASQDNVRRDEETQFADLTYPIRAFFPSNLEDAEDSLLVLEGEASLTIGDGFVYTSAFNYSVSRFENRENGEAEEVILVPVDNGPAAEFLRQNFSASYGDQLVRDLQGIRLGWENSVEITAKYQNDWNLTSTRYGFYDAANKFVGAVFIPVIAPAAE